MRRAVVLFAALACSGLFIDCKKAPSFEEKLAAGLTANGIKLPAATGATIATPHEGLMVLVMRDTVGTDNPEGFALIHEPIVVFKFDAARAATEGAEAKYKKTPADPIIVPLLNLTSTYGEMHPGTKTVFFAASDPVPPQLFKELRATIAANGITDQYRLVKSSDGKVTAEKLPAL